MMRSLLAVALAMSFGVAAAQAVPVSYRITGELGTVSGGLTSQFTPGDSFEFLYTFESTMPARGGSDANFAVYDALTSATLTTGSYVATGTGADVGEIQVDNDPPFPFSDRYAVLGFNSDGFTGPTVNGYTLLAAGARFDDSTNTVFSTALTLPATIALSDFDSSLFLMLFDQDQFISGRITGLQQANAVPEPMTASLLISGLGGLALAVRRRR